MTRKSKTAFNLKAFLSKVGDGHTTSTYRKSQIVFSQGDDSNAVFYLVKGSVKITVVSQHGKEAIVAILGANDFFGEGCLAGQKKRIATVKTLAESTIVRFGKKNISALIQKEPEFSDIFMTYLLTRTIRAEADLVDQLFNSSEKRLARLLLLLVNFGQDNDSKPRITKISQETLAEMIGTTRARVSFFMNKFRRMGFIDYNGHIEVHRSLLNVVLHEHPHIAGDRSGKNLGNGSL